MKNSSERVRKHRKRLREKGFVKVESWVRREFIQAVKDFVKQLEKKSNENT